MKKRYAFMDVIRLFSMLGIVYYHMVMSLYICGIRQYESISPLFENKNIHVATVGVGLFFMISGAGLMLSTKGKDSLNLGKYYFKRFVRILIPFYVVYVLYLVTFIALTKESLAHIYDVDASPFSVIFTLLGMDAYISTFGIPTFSLGIGEWFLGALVMMYIIFPFLRFILLKNKWIALGLMSVYYIIILITYDYMPYADVVPGFTNFTCKVYEFFLGMFFILIIDQFAQDDKKYLLLKKICLFTGIPILLFFIICPIALPINQNLMILIENIACFMIFVGLEGFFNKIPLVIKSISFLCIFSYEFFLIHHKVIDYMTLQHIGVPFSNKDVLILFVQEFVVICILTLLVKGLLILPSKIRHLSRNVSQESTKQKTLNRKH